MDGFSDPFSISSDAFNSWMNVLNQTQGDSTMLILLRHNDEMENNLRIEAEKRNINSKRIIFMECLPAAYWKEHVRRYKMIDVYLDTPRICGRISILCEALLSGTPMICFEGDGEEDEDNIKDRIGSSLLKSIGFDDLIVSNILEEEYEKLAVFLQKEEDKFVDILQRLDDVNRMTEHFLNPYEWMIKYEVVLEGILRSRAWIDHH